MKMYLMLLLLGLFCASCDRKTASPATATAAFKSSNAAACREDEFSAWMTKAEQQVIHETKPAGHYFADVEGRNIGGLNQYRHVLRPFPQDKYSEWAVYWGLSAEEFYQLELKMLRSGYSREHLQVFVDAQGVAFHQAVWLKARTKRDTANATKPPAVKP